MTTNPVIENALKKLRSELRQIPGIFGNEYVLFGSTVLYLHGLRSQIGDVDVFATKYVFDHLEQRGWDVIRPREDDPPFLELRPTGPFVPIHVFYAWTSRDQWMSVSRCFRLAENRPHRFDVWPCVPLEEVARHKREAWLNWDGPEGGDAKHVRDLARLDAVLTNRAPPRMARLIP